MSNGNVGNLSDWESGYNQLLLEVTGIRVYRKISQKQVLVWKML
jgi:hypothetical protein